MSSERDTYRRKADEAKQRAAQASEPFVKSAYEKVAELEIAGTERSKRLKRQQPERKEKYRKRQCRAIQIVV
jgi:hypothetical protein